MEFRLLYKGPLATNGTLREKHVIRQAFHPQLAELFRQSPISTKREEFLNPLPPPGHEASSLIFVTGPFQFVALVSQRLNLICHLDILFLRREEPGAIITQGGDIDNRLKTLLDALRYPRNMSELSPGATPQAGETPFYCLLEDDNLVTRLNITTDRLLESSTNPTHVSLVIHVTIKGSPTTFDNIDLIG